MEEDGAIITGLGQAELDRVLVRGYDLTEELVGRVTFADMTYLMLVGRLPTPAEARLVDALLVVLVEHGLVASVVAARLTYHTAPEAIQGAVAAALLGAGSVHLGSSEWCARMLVEALPAEAAAVELEAVAARVVERYAAANARLPGIGHRTHAAGDPRAERLFEVAEETGVAGRYGALLRAIAAEAEGRLGRRLPVNVTGAIAACALDLGLPWQLTKAFALIGRTLGALAHLGEEIRQPLARPIDAAIKARVQYRVEPPPSARPGHGA